MGQRVPESAWQSLLAEPKQGDEHGTQGLIAGFPGVVRQRPDLGMYAGVRRRDEAGYRWLKYKEAFSPDLVRAVFDGWTALEGPVLDPFAGSGTSLLVAAERGLDAIGIELLPYAGWAANTSVQAH